MRIAFLVFFALISTAKLKGQVATGQPAPGITVDEWIDNPNYQFRNFEGKVIVLDFWFLNCAPCIYTIPHLNALSRQYSKEEVVFLAVTFNKAESVSKYLWKKALLANVGTDTTRQLISRFGVVGYPTTFLIDQMGIIRWTGYPQDLNSEKLDMALGKKYFPKLVPDSNVTTSGSTGDPNESKSVFPVEIAVNDYMGQRASGSQIIRTEIGFVNRSLNQIFGEILKTSSNRISSPDTNRYDISCKVPRDYPQEKIGQVFIHSVLEELGYELGLARKKVQGYRLNVLNDSLLIKHAVDPGASGFTRATEVRWDIWTGKGHQFSELIRELESRFNVFIRDESEVNGFFRFQFPVKNFEGQRKFFRKDMALHSCLKSWK
jgi:thiol-disulfide isomerase/thioredoxin